MLNADDLLSVGVSLPEGDTVLFGHVPALGQHLRVGYRLLSCIIQSNNDIG